MKTIILDNGHGKETHGKRSPVWGGGSQLFEYEFNRDIVKRIASELVLLGIPHVILVPEEKDITLEERSTRANKIKDAILISIHANAGGGTGWEAFTTVGTTKSDAIATILYEEAMKEFPEWKVRTDYSDGDNDKESQFYILRKVIHPAVLTENFFMDTEKDCRFIMSEEGRQRIANMHVKAIQRLMDE